MVYSDFLLPPPSIATRAPIRANEISSFYAVVQFFQIKSVTENRRAAPTAIIDAYFPISTTSVGLPVSTSPEISFSASIGSWTFFISVQFDDGLPTQHRVRSQSREQGSWEYLEHCQGMAAPPISAGCLSGAHSTEVRWCDMI